MMEAIFHFNENEFYNVGGNGQLLAHDKQMAEVIYDPTASFITEFTLRFSDGFVARAARSEVEVIVSK